MEIDHQLVVGYDTFHLAWHKGPVVVKFLLLFYISSKLILIYKHFVFGKLSTQNIFKIFEENYFQSDKTFSLF